jgi:hypothetical protein
VQKFGRGCIVRNHVDEVRKGRKVLRKAVASRDESQLRSALAATKDHWFKVKESYLAGAVMESINEERALVPELESVSRLDPMPPANFKKYEALYEKMMLYISADPEAFQQPLAVQVRAKYIEAATNKCGKALQSAIKKVHDGNLAKVIAKARAVHMHEHADERVRKVLEKGVKLLAKIKKVKLMLTKAIESVKESHLVKATERATEVGYVKGTPGEKLFGTAETLLRWVRALTSMAQQASFPPSLPSSLPPFLPSFLSSFLPFFLPSSL